MASANPLHGWLSVLSFIGVAVSLAGPARAAWTNSTVASVQAAYTAIVLDSSGTPHIAYQNLTSNSALSIADYSGSSWTLTTIGNPPMSANNQGFGTTLARDQSNNLFSTSMQSSPKNIHLIKRVGGTWTSATNLPNVGAGTGNTCVFVSTPNVYAAYFDSGLKFFSSADMGASVGSVTTIDAGANAGQYCSIVSTGTAGIHISYYDTTNGDLKYAFYNGSAWTTASVDTTGTVGSFTSIALDASSRPHISYIDSTNIKVKHAYKNAGAWTTEIVDASSGSYTSIAVSSMNPQIAYYNPALGQLKWAGYDGVSWSTETVDATGGQYAAMALDSSGNAHIVSVYGATAVRYSVRAAASACAAVASAGSGDWSAGGTWSGGTAPTSCTPVTIAAGHTVTVNTASAEAGAVTVSGTLSFSRSANATLSLTGGDVSVSAGGTLDLGTEASPIPSGVSAALRLSTGAAGAAYGLLINDGGNFSARGSTRSPFGYAVASLSNGAVSLQVAASSATGWAVGDTLSIGPTAGQGAATVEDRVITSITGTDPLTVNWTGGLSAARTLTANTPIVVANLTRNVVIASSGTTVTAAAGGTGGNNAYVRALASHTTGFYAAHASFEKLGAARAGRQGLFFDGSAAVGTVSSSVFQSGYRGLVVSSASALTLTGNIYARNLDAGLLLESGGESAISESLAYGNAGSGFTLANSSGNTLSWTRSFANGGDGFALSSRARDVAISSSASHNNTGHGLSVSGAATVNTMVSASSLYLNGGDGINVVDAVGSSVSEDNIFSNTGAGMKVCGNGSQGHYILGGNLGYDSSGSSKANANGEFRSCSSGGIKAQLNQAKVNPANGGIVATTLCAGDSVSSYNENGVAGSAHVFGDFKLTASTFTLTHVKRTNAPAYTGPTTVKGDGHTLTSIVVNDAAVNELFKIVNTGGASWSVTGQKSGLVGTITCGASASCAFSVAQLSFNLATGAAVRTGDRIHLVTHQPSNDANAGKGLRVGPACPAFNGGISKISVPAGSGIDLQGIAGVPTTIDSLDGVSSFTFVSSGAFTMSYSSVSRADENGVQLSGPGPVTLGNSAFGNTGGNTASCALLTMNSLSVTATLPALYFGHGNVCPNPHSILVRGDTTGLNLTIEAPTGPLAGEDYINDTSGKTLTGGGGPYIPGSAALVSVSTWSITAQWTRNSNSTGTIFTAQASTAADFSGALFSSATMNLQGLIAGVSPNTTYFLQVNASTGGVSSAYRSLGSTLTLAAVPVAADFSGVGLAQLTANWTANGNPAGTSYTAVLSSGASPGTNGFAGNQSSTTLNASATFTGLTAGRSYFAEVRAANAAGIATVYASLSSTVTLAAPPTAGAYTGVGAAALTANWGANGNPAGTTYTAILSSGASPATNGFSGNQSSATVNVFAVFTGLSPGTTYFSEVRAGAGAYVSLSSTVTLPAAPVAAAYSGVTGAALTANWTANGNPAGTLYTAILSTGASPSTNGFAGNVSSATYNLSASYAGLALNTTYFAEVKATNSGGAASAYTSLGAGVTLAAPPAAAAPSAITAAQLTLNWGANGDPAGTLYEAFLSTDAGYAASVSSSTRDVSATFTGLSGNTTYFSRVRAVNHGGVATNLTDLAAALTLPAAPAAAPYVAAAYQVRAVWTANTNATGTSYTVILSTGASPSTNAFAGNVASTTLNLSALFPGLGPNTTYYAEVRATGFAGANSEYTSLGLTMTSPVSPLPPTVGQGILTVSSVSVTGSWGASAGNTHYTMAASTSADGAGQPGALASTSTGTAASGALFGLTPNTTYQCFASACNAISCSTYTALGSTITLAALPSFTASVPQTAQLTFNWNANNNPAGTPYTLVFSSGPSPRDNGFAGNQSSTTLNTSAVFTGLNANTTYYAELKAANGNGLETAYASLPSAVTLAAAPIAAAYSGVTTAQLTASWTANGNPAGTIYTAILSSGASPSTNGFAGNQSSTTLSASADFAGLSVNTTYFVSVKAVNRDGVSSAFASLGSTVTLAAAPSAAAPSGVQAAQLTLNWGANGNPAGTAYTAILSTGASPETNGFAGNQSSTTLNASATITGLTANATYYAAVRAANFGGTATAYTALPSTVTLTAPPTAAPYTGVGVSSLTANWSANGNPAGTSYTVILSSGASPSTNGFAGNQSSTTLNASASFTGLNPNATYYAEVRAGAGPYVNLSSTVTLALPPAGSAATPVGTASAGLTWGAGGNPAGTIYQMQVSAAADFSGAASSRTALTTASVSGLTPNTTYFLRVRAEDAAGAATAFDATVTTVTLTAAPVSLAVNARSATTLTFQWGAAANPGDTVYTAQLSTAADFSGTVTSNQTVDLQSGFSSLTNGTTYYSRVRAAGRGGQLTAFTAAASTMTVAAAPGTPVLSAYALSSTTIRWSWTQGAGGAVASYRMYATSGVATSPLLAGNASFYMETGLSVNTLYSRWVRASNEAGNAFSSTDSVSIPISYDLQAGAASSGTLVDPGTGLATLEIPAGATADTMRWLVSVKPVSQPLVDVTPQLIVDANSRLRSGLTGSTQSVREYLVTINDVRYTGNFLQPVTVIVPYPDADNDGFVDGTTPPVSVDTLRLYTLNETTSVWELMAVSTIDKVNKTVRGQVPHLSIYTAMGTGTASAGPAAADTSGVRVYPNPWRPGSGGDYDAPAVVFDGLPAQATIRVYTLGGSLVRSFEKSDGSNQLQWDGSDENGTRLASGVYYYLVTSPTGGKKKGRLAVIR